MTFAGLLLRFCKITGVTVLLSAGVLYGGLLAVLYAKQDGLLFPADRGQLDVAAAGVPGLDAVTIRTADGLVLTAWFRKPAPGMPTLVYFHGNGGNPGLPSEDGLHQDALAAMGFLAAQGIADDRVVVYGEALGTGVAVWLATQKKFAAVILGSPYTSIATVTQPHLWFLPAKLLISEPSRMASKASRVRSSGFWVVPSRMRALSSIKRIKMKKPLRSARGPIAGSGVPSNCSQDRPSTMRAFKPWFCAQRTSPFGPI